MARLEIDRTVLRVWAIPGVAAIPFFAICGYRIEAKVWPQFLFCNLRLQNQGKGVAAIPFFAICGYRMRTKV